MMAATNNATGAKEPCGAAGGYKSAFAGLKGTQAEAATIIRRTLRRPARTAFGRKTIDVYNAAGQGVRIERGTNKFVGFLEAHLSTR